MNIEDIIALLATWTPYLLEGFGWNLLIAAVTMLVGTAIGVGLAYLRMSTYQIAVRSSGIIADCSRNIPTVVCQFYLAVMLPSSVPGWIKAVLAISVVVAGFVADNLPDAIRSWQRNEKSKALLFLPAWTTLFVNVVVSSSYASLIGVNEIVSRCNVVVNATGNTALLIPIYLYAGSFFFLFCFPLTLAMRRIRRNMSDKANAGTVTTKSIAPELNSFPTSQPTRQNT